MTNQWVLYSYKHLYSISYNNSDLFSESIFCQTYRYIHFQQFFFFPAALTNSYWAKNKMNNKKILQTLQMLQSLTMVFWCPLTYFDYIHKWSMCDVTSRIKIKFQLIQPIWLYVYLWIQWISQNNCLFHVFIVWPTLFCTPFIWHIFNYSTTACVLLYNVEPIHFSLVISHW